MGTLSGLTILDLTTVLSGPMATGILADQGARVIKVESPGGDLVRFTRPLRNGVSSPFVNVNRNKESIVLDLKTAEGVDAVLKLAAASDVLVENFRPDVMARLGLGYGVLKQINPGLVYASINGAGRNGPYSERRTYDSVVQAITGYASANRKNGKPELIPILICDKVTALTAAQAICAAIIGRARTGQGQHVEISMIEACLYFLWSDHFPAESFVEGADTAPADLSQLRTLATKDGFITILTTRMPEFKGLCRALDRLDWLEDERFSSMRSLGGNLGALFDLAAEEFKLLETASLAAKLLENDVPHGIVLDREGVLNDEHIKATGIIQILEDPIAGPMRYVARNARFSEEVLEPAKPAEELGASTKAIAKEFGLELAGLNQD